MKRPSFQFYPADWRNNAKLRRCTHAERGIWIDVMCVMHDSEEYGVLRWPLKEIAQAVGCRVADLKALSEKEVLKGSDKSFVGFSFAPYHAGKRGEPVTLIDPSDGPVWFSSRMVTDEYVRQRRGASTRFTSDDQPASRSPNHTPKGSPKDQPKDGIGSTPKGGFVHGPTSSSTSTEGSNKRQQQSDASTGRTPEMPPPQPPIERNVAIAVLIRGWESARSKASKITSANPHVLEWAQSGITDQRLREAYDIAVADREAAGESQPINAGFLDVFVRRLTEEAQRAPTASTAAGATPKPWHQSAKGIEAKGAELGITQGRDEAFPVFKHRVYAAAGVTKDDLRPFENAAPSGR